MKTLDIIKSYVLLSSIIVSLVACTEQIEGEGDIGNIIPQFPELVEDYAVLPGSVHEITFTPNMDWEISIPNEIRQWFWIKDGAFSVVSISGPASESPVSVSIEVTAVADFDRNYSCDVTLTLGDSSKVVAKYMLPAKEKALEIYVAQKSPDGTYQLSDDGDSYIYSAEPASALDFVWSDEVADFILPIKVVANCDWSLKMPDWADVNIPEKIENVMEFVLSGFSLKDEEGKLVFVSGDIVLKELNMTIPSGNMLNIYSAIKSDEGYDTDEAGELLWSEELIEEVSMDWTGVDFRHPIKIDSRCDWTIECPKWLTVAKYPDMDELSLETAGQMVLLLKGVPSEYPEDDSEGEVVFKVGDTIIKRLKVNMPGCKDIFSYTLGMNLLALEYNYLGHLKTTSGYEDISASMSVLGTKNTRIFTVETTGGRINETDNIDWLNVDIERWNSEKGASVLQTRKITITASENKGNSERTAVLFVLPQTISESVAELFDEDGNVKESYAQYSISVSQASNEFEISINDVEDALFVFEELDGHEKDIIVAQFNGAGYIYQLTYSDKYARDNATMMMKTPYSTYRIFDSDMVTDKTDDEDFWLKFTEIGENKSTGVVDMYLTSTLPPVPSLGYIIFYSSNDEVLAVVKCVSPIGDYITMTVNDDLPYIFNLHPDKTSLSSIEGYDETDNVYRLTYKESSANDCAVMNMAIPYHSYTIFDSDMVTEKTEDEDFWLRFKQDEGNKSATVLMYDELTLPVSANIGYLVLYGPDGKVYAIVECISPFESVDPDTKFDVGTERFVNPAVAEAAGATIYEITAGPTYNDNKQYRCTVLKLTYKDQTTALKINIPKQARSFTVNPASNHSFATVNDKDIDNDAGQLLEWNEQQGKYVGTFDGIAEIKMHSDKSDSATVLFYNSNSSVILVLVCVLDLD